MAWLYVPGLEASNSRSTSRAPAIELFVSSSETLMPRPPSWPGWKTRPWMTRLSGTMCAASTADHGAASWISSLRATRASPSRLRVGGAERTTRGTSGRRSRGSSGKRALAGSSSKTSWDICRWAFPRSAKNCGPWATALRRDYSRRLRSARATSGAGCSFWATPTRVRNANSMDIAVGEGLVRFHLTPGQHARQKSPSREAMAWTALYTLLRSVGWEPSRRRRSRRFPSSLPVQATLRVGTGGSAGGLIYNPRFTEWLLGWPIGWTDCRKPVTEFAHWLRQSRSALLDLLSRPIETTLEEP